MKISNVNEMRNLDHRAITEYGIPQEILMENAGQACYQVISKEFGLNNRKFVIFCGIGNNGGDGLVVARKIHSQGGEATVIIVGDYSKYTGAARLNLDIVEKTQIRILKLHDLAKARELVQNADVVIDAVFGTGLDREVTGIYKDVISLINTSRKTVFSLDIPSGINGDTGQVMGVAIKADYTVSFGLPKTGNLLYPGFDHCGKLYVTHISFPPALYQSDSMKTAINEPIPIPHRNRDSHKGNYGKTLFIAGSLNYLGAPYFAALSFLKAGGGLSYLATPERISSLIGNKGSEIVFIPLTDTETGSISLENKDQLVQFSEKVDLVVIGPGLSLHDQTQTLVRKLCAEIKKPLLIDGDGITAVANDLNCIMQRTAPAILTPHAGEMATITGLKTETILNDKISILQDTCQKLHATIVFKGAHSLIGYPDNSVFVNLSGNPGMACAGSGDVLTGVIPAMAGIGFSIEDAVRMGVFIHGFAGDLAADEKGEDGLVAGDIMEHLPYALKILRTDFKTAIADFYHTVYSI